MTASDAKGSPSGGTSRKERRAAERAARKRGLPSPAPASSQGRGPSMFAISIAAVVIGLVAVGALIIASGGLGGDEVAAVSEPDLPAPAAELQDGRSLRDPDVAQTVTVEAFEDPQCPACGQFTARIEPLLIAGAVTDGVVRFTYRDFPFLGPESFEAAVAMRAAEALDGKFWEYHQILFHNQSGENQGAFTRERLADMAELIGLEREAFLAEMDNPDHLAAVNAELTMGRELGVNSTPTLVINGQVFPGVPDWNELKDRIDAAAAAAPAEASPEAPAAEAPATAAPPAATPAD